MAENNPGTEERLADALSEYIDLLNSDAAPSIDRFLAKHAGLAVELRPMLEAANVVGEEACRIVPPSVSEGRFAAIRARVLRERGCVESPHQVQEGPPLMAINKRPDFLILMVEAMGELWGVTRMVKMLLLLGDQVNAVRFAPDYYAHTADNYGPFDKTVYRDIKGLERTGILEAARPEVRVRRADEDLDLRREAKAVEAVYRLTPKGRQVAKALTASAEAADPAILAGVREVAAKYGRLPLEDLIRIVYRRYPHLTTKSRIRDRILGDDE